MDKLAIAKEIVAFFEGQPVEISIFDPDSPSGPFAFPALELRAFRDGSNGSVFLVSASPLNFEGTSSGPFKRLIYLGKSAKFDPEDGMWSIAGRGEDRRRFDLSIAALGFPPYTKEVAEGYAKSRVKAEVKAALDRYPAGFADVEQVAP